MFGRWVIWRQVTQRPEGRQDGCQKMELLELVKIVDTHQNQANVQQQIDALKRVDFLFARMLIILIIVSFAVSLLLAWYQSWQLNKRVKKLEAKSEQRPII